MSAQQSGTFTIIVITLARMCTRVSPSPENQLPSASTATNGPTDHSRHWR